jgi:hypothetical protein
VKVGWPAAIAPLSSPSQRPLTKKKPTSPPLDDDNCRPTAQLIERDVREKGKEERGFDMQAFDDYLMNKLPPCEYPEEEVQRAMRRLKEMYPWLKFER